MKPLCSNRFSIIIRCMNKQGISFGIVRFMNPYEPRLKDFLVVVGVALLFLGVIYAIHILHK